MIYYLGIRKVLETVHLQQLNTCSFKNFSYMPDLTGGKKQ